MRHQINITITEVIQAPRRPLHRVQRSVRAATVRLYEQDKVTPATIYSADPGGVVLATPFKSNSVGRVVHDDSTVLFCEPQMLWVTATKGSKSWSFFYPAYVPGAADALAGTVDTVASRALVTPASNSEGGFTVKAPSAAWGDGTAYGHAQALLLLRDDHAGENLYGSLNAEPDRNVLARMNGRDGAIGTAGGMHIAVGLRQHPGYATTQSIWIDPYNDVHGIIVDAANDAPVSHFLLCRTNDGTLRASIASNGLISASAHDPEAVVTMGWQFGQAGLKLGGDVSLRRTAPDVLSLFDLFRVERATGGGHAFRTEVTGDVEPRLVINANGEHFWGSGAAAADVALARTAADELSLFDLFRIERAASANPILRAYVTGDANPRLQMNASGLIAIGPGGGAGVDTTLNRVGNGIFGVTSAFELPEIADLAAPAVNKGRLYVRDNGAGKTELVFRPPTGAIKVLATED